MGAGNLAAVDKRAVRALEVDQDDFAILDDNAGMAFRYVRFWQDNVIAFHTPNENLGLVKCRCCGRTVFLGDGHTKHMNSFMCCSEILSCYLHPR